MGKLTHDESDVDLEVVLPLHPGSQPTLVPTVSDYGSFTTLGSLLRPLCLDCGDAREVGPALFPCPECGAMGQGRYHNQKQQPTFKTFSIIDALCVQFVCFFGVGFAVSLPSSWIRKLVPIAGGPPTSNAFSSGS